MKRRLDRDEASSSPNPFKNTLGATEFAATLNGEDDPKQTLIVLKQFVKAVRWERNLALSLTDDDNDDDDDSGNHEEGDEEEPPSAGATTNEDTSVDTAKKRRQEEWTMDSQNYNVPFVGTALAKGRDLGTVIQGQWPCGLLQAYLLKSPMAIELTSDRLLSPHGAIHKRLLRNNQGKLSRAIDKAYLEALRELISAAIPIPILQHRYSNGGGVGLVQTTTTTTTTKHSTFLKPIIKDRLPTFLSLLNDQRTKSTATATATIAAPLLDILTQLSSISVGIARDVVIRGLDSSIREGVLRGFLKVNVSSMNPKDTSNNNEPSWPTRIACLRLATILVKWNDPTIASYICTGGSRDRKSPPGLLHLALKYGIIVADFTIPPGGHQSSQHYFQNAVARLLQAIRGLLLVDNSVLSRRALIELLVSTDTLQHLAKLATCGAATAFVDFKAVLSSNDEDGTDSTNNVLEKVAQQARRLLFPLLADRIRSPFLTRISGQMNDKTSILYSQHIVKAMNTLHAKYSSIPMQKFLIHVLTVTPFLTQHYSRSLSLPDSKEVFAFISQMGFIDRLLRDGPPMTSCIVDSTNQEHLLSLLVLPCIKKQCMMKALQSTNPLVVCEALKTTMIILQRCHASQRMDDAGMTDAISKRLVDLPTILTVRLKFNVWDPQSNMTAANDVVYMLMCQTLGLYSKALPQISARWDWFKLLPDTSLAFSKASPLVQLQTLSTIFENSQCLAGQSSKATSLNGLRVILEIMMGSKHIAVYEKSKSIAMQTLCAMLLYENDIATVKDAVMFEVELWINSLQPTKVKEFLSFCAGPDASAFQHTIRSAQAWKESDLPGAMGTLFHSSILTAALCGFAKSSMPDTISRIAGRCLLYHNDPMPLAALISHVFKSLDIAENSNHFVLCNYSHSLLCCSPSVDDIAPKLRTLLPLLVSPKHFEITHGKVFNLLPATFKNASKNRIVEATRMCMHIRMMMQDMKSHEVIQDSLTSMLHMFAQSEWSSLAFQSLLEHPFFRANASLTAERTLQYMLLLSRGPDFFRGNITQAMSFFDQQFLSGMKMDKDTQIQLLRLWLLKPYLPTTLLMELSNQLLQVDIDEENIAITNAFQLNWVKNINEELPESSPRIGFNAFIRAVSRESTSAEVVAVLEASLSKRCRKDDYYADFCSEPSNTILSTCLRSQIIQVKNLGPQPISPPMLSVVLTYDTFRFLPLLTELMGFNFEGIELNENQMRQLLDAGTFDEAFLILARYQVGCGESQYDNSVTSFALHRAVSILTNSTSDADFAMAANIFESYIAGANEQTCKRCCEAISHFLLAQHLNFSVYSLFVSCLVKFLQVVSHRYCTVKLAVDILSHCFDTLPNLLKESSKQSTGKPSIAPKLVVLLNGVVAILGSIHDSLLSTIMSKIPSGSVDNCIRSCMKYCIRMEYGDGMSTAIGCVAVLRVLLNWSLSAHVAMENFLAQSTFLHPKILLNMIISHSKFSSFVTSESENQHEIKFAVFQLVDACLAGCGHSVSLDKSTWFALLSLYSASMSEQDCILRRILFAAADCNEGYVPSFHEMRWKGVSFGRENCVNDKGDSDWQWLIDALDIVRIHTTLHQFPLHDSITSDNSDQIQFGTENEGGHTGDESLDEAVGGETKVKVEEQSNGADNDNGPKKWQGRGEDIRYSPAFVVPLIFGALESLVPEAIEGKQDIQLVKDSKTGMNLTEESETEFVTMAQRLCEKGALALCIASLSSRCRVLREIAISTLGLFMRATNSTVAQELSTWRSRPQIAVLLNSLQRGMAVRRAKFVRESPNLPVLSAVFLAKASFIMTKPGDPMFGPINKYFLKIENGHGAYDDIHRLPGFIPFFCSSSDEGDQAKNERIWALQFLKDSFVDSSCYRMILSCHASELILSALQGISARSDDEVDLERTLLIETITRIVKYGGKAASNHLIGRLGLVSWVVSFLGGNDVKLALPTADSRRAFLELVWVVCQEAYSRLEVHSSENVFFEFRCLSQPILAVVACLDDSSDDLVKELASKVIFSLVSIIAEISTEPAVLIPTFSIGIQAESASHFLSIAPHEWKPRLAWALCSVELEETSSCAVRDFMINLLNVLPTMKDHGHILPVLERIQLLAKTSIAVDHTILIGKVLASRQVCFCNPATREAWIACLGAFLINMDNLQATLDNPIIREAQMLVGALNRALIN